VDEPKEDRIVIKKRLEQQRGKIMQIYHDLEAKVKSPSFNKKHVWAKGKACGSSMSGAKEKKKEKKVSVGGKGGAYLRQCFSISLAYLCCC
jgi:hypothetical protein